MNSEKSQTTTTVVNIHVSRAIDGKNDDATPLAQFALDQVFTKQSAAFE